MALRWARLGIAPQLGRTSITTDDVDVLLSARAVSDVYDVLYFARLAQRQVRVLARKLEAHRAVVIELPKKTRRIRGGLALI